MNVKYALFGIAFTALAAPVLAADQFYIVQDAATKKCAIVRVKPTVDTSTLVNNTVYKTQAAAKSGMSAAKACAK